MKKNKKTWYSNMPWGRRLEIEDEIDRQQDKADNNIPGDGLKIDYSLFKSIRGWIERRKEKKRLAKQNKNNN